MKIIARIENGFETKFGVPRQSGLAGAVLSRIVFEPAYRNPDALRGLEDFSHLWLIWEFSQAKRDAWSPTVRPPRLGGNARMGVFATRSPFRPNPIGLSCVKIHEIRPQSEIGPLIFVSGADLMNGTPIYDIKPYLPYADCHPEAAGGFTDAVERIQLAVDCSPELLAKIPKAHRAAVLEILSQDPRPSYQHDPERVYGMAYAGMDVRFRVEGERLTVTEIRTE
ncbi:MAG: tRNA (N6-threonylcarbamoyladenosine(37)-N6)-methyltransferase TrmO [Clostridia bacterium]|nr:tRNA (N6-threonylcarbamoyladenosine(37)-N6)-methyltransferase TrmO [Clostridia bacterium]